MSSQPPRRIPDPLAPLRFGRLVLSLSLVVSFYLFFTLSLRLFPQTCPRSVSFLRPVSPMVATSEFESRRVEGLSRRGRGGRGEKRTLSKCYPLGPSLPLLLLSFFLSLSRVVVSFSLPSPRISLFLLLSSGGQRTGARRDRNHTHARCEPTRL